MQITQMLLTPNKFSRPQTPLKKVTKIAVHYVGNAGSSAKGNRNYFESLKDGKHGYASSHYIVGLKGEVIQCVPETEVAYCTNEANSYSISIENCHPSNDGKFAISTRYSLMELCADLCKRYGLNPLTDIIRHYDVTGKKCPLYWVTHPDDFTSFKHEVASFMSEKKEIKPDTANFSINGNFLKADRILYNGENYIKVKALENVGFVIGYDKDTKLVTIDNLIKILPIEFNGEIQGVESLNLHDYNFVSLRPLLAMLGYSAEYNPETKGVAIQPKK